MPVPISCGRSHSIGNKPRRSFVGHKFIWREVFQYTPVGEGRKDGLKGRVGS